MSTKEERERIELLQGTLDLLILQTLLLGPAHGHAIATSHRNSVPKTSCKSNKDLSIPRSTGSSSADGFPWRKELRRTIAAPNSTS